MADHILPRMPDPTLTEHQHERMLVYVATSLDNDIAVAHRSDYTGRLCARVATPILTKHARWFSVPCRNCFPDAPPPGSRALPPWSIPDPNLTWQES